MDAVGVKWAGNFACTVCKRKRLTAAAFSATQLRRLRAGKVAEGALRCKECVADAEASVSMASPKSNDGEVMVCGGCGPLTRGDFSNTQAARDEAARRCRSCVSNTEKLEAAAVAKRKKERAVEVSTAANASGGTALDRMHAAAAECALEAEEVTGLAPVRGSSLRRGGRRGRARTWRGRGRGHGSK